MPRSAVPALVALLLVAAGVPRGARAGEAEVASWKKAAAAFPEPSAAKGFDWAIDVVTVPGGVTVGSGRLVVAVGTHDGKPAWTSEDTVQIQAFKAHATQTFSRELATVHIESQTEGPESKRVVAETKEGHLAVRVKDGDKPAVEGTLAEPVLEGASGVLLALRLLPAEPAEYETAGIDDDATSGDALRQQLSISVKGKQPWSFRDKEREALVYEVRDGKATLRIALDPTTRDLLALEFVGKPLAIVPKGSVAPKDKVDLSKPATTPQIAAVKVAIGFTTGDVQLIADGLHWPSVKEADVAPEAKGMSVEEYKKVVIAKIVEQKQAERSSIEPAVLAIVDQLKTEKRADGRVVVTFPESYNGFSLVTGEHDGVWYVDEVPE